MCLILEPRETCNEPVATRRQLQVYAHHHLHPLRSQQHLQALVCLPLACKFAVLTQPGLCSDMRCITLLIRADQCARSGSSRVTWCMASNQALPGCWCWCCISYSNACRAVLEVCLASVAPCCSSPALTMTCCNRTVLCVIGQAPRCKAVLSAQQSTQQCLLSVSCASQNTCLLLASSRHHPDRISLACTVGVCAHV